MKKFFLLLSIILPASAFVISGCQKANINESTINVEESQLLTDLSALNQQILSEYPSTKGLGKICAIVGADFLAGYEGAEKGAKVGAAIGFVCAGQCGTGAIVGGAIGCLVCGGGASYAVGKGLGGGCITNGEFPFDDLYKQCATFYPDLMSPNNGYEFVENMMENLELVPVQSISAGLKLPAKAIKVGALHNVVLEELNTGVLEDNVFTVTEGITPAISAEEGVIAGDSQLYETCKTTLQDFITKQPNINNYFISKDGISDKVMELYHDIFERTSYESEGLVDIINQYYNIVDKSNELTLEEKESIYAGLSISLFSYNYWVEKGYEK